MAIVLKNKIKEHLREYIFYYILLFIFLILGIIAGAYMSTTYEKEEIELLNDFFNNAISIYKEQECNYNEIFKSSFLNGIKNIGFVWILGFTVIGIPFILSTVFKCGFMLGLYTTFIISIYSVKGIVISIVIILSQCIILIPVLFIVSSFSLHLCTLISKIIFGKIKYKLNLKSYIFNYLILLIAAVMGILIYTLMETYFSSNVLKWLFLMQ